MSDSRQNRYNIENIHSRHAAYLKRMSEIGKKDRFDKDTMDLGFDWYKSGRKLEEAESKLQSNSSFVAGYNRAMRIDNINKDLYLLGREHFEQGIPLVKISPQYTSSEYFIKGFNDALNESLKKDKPRH